jgi:hypothetical protein
MKSELKKQDWSEFDKLMESFGNPTAELPERKIKDDLKSRLLGADVMSDAQHKMIIAIFTNELDWRADEAFKFILKVIPEIKIRLGARVIQETEIQTLYKKLKKKEASKLINILKSISGRRKKCQSKIKKG